MKFRGRVSDNVPSMPGTQLGLSKHLPVEVCTPPPDPSRGQGLRKATVLLLVFFKST